MTQYECFDDQVIEEELNKLPDIMDLEKTEQKTNVFKILGDLNRVKIIELLAHYERLCVYEISRFIEASVATTSHHLITLRTSGIINSEKHGKRVVYALEDEEIIHLLEAATEVIELVNKKELTI